jgi:hypothetical protein
MEQMMMCTPSRPPSVVEGGGIVLRPRLLEGHRYHESRCRC